MKRIDLEHVHVPDEEQAEERSWHVVSRAYAGYQPRPPAPARGRWLAIALAAAAAAALIAVAVSPAGSSIVHSVREAVGVTKSAPALTRLPASGELLVRSAEGPWIVQPNGSKRLLGRYGDATWSPHGLFLAVTRGHELLAVDPHGDVRWSLARPGTIRLPRWAPDGYRIAYLDGSALRVVAGDGTGDRAFAGPVARVAAAWRPSTGHDHIVAFVSADGRLQLYDADTRTLHARHRLPAAPRQLLWTSDGRRLVAISTHAVSVFDRNGKLRTTIRLIRRASSAAVVPRSHRLALVLVGNRSQAVVFDLDRPRVPPADVFGGAGRFTGLAWSPDGKWLLVAWETADQWVFVRTSDPQRIAAVSSIASQFNPTADETMFPTLRGWCCGAP